jgi:hypothetical protein
MRYIGSSFDEADRVDARGWTDDRGGPTWDWPNRQEQR